MKSCLFVCLVLVECVFARNILFLSGVPSPSHHIYNRVLAVGLAGKGHNVTFISADLVEKPTPNLHYIHLNKTYDVFQNIGGEPMNILDFADHPPTQSVWEMPDMMMGTCAGNLASDGIDEILNYPKNFKFDLVLYDFTFGPCLLPLVARFNYPPLISISGFANPPYVTDLAGGQKHPAYVPHYAVNHPNGMTIAERFFNTWLYFVDWVSREMFVYRQIEQQTKEKFKFDYPPLKELGQRSALVFVNTDNSFDFPEPLEPNMIQIGGLQVARSNPLPEEMEKFISAGKKGTVLMSLGTNVKSNMLGEEMLKSIIKTFALIPDFNFLWKFESDEKDLPIALSKNVMVGKFLPQNDILAHPNLKAFISHSGMLSTHEAMWHGKPIIGMPVFVDQRRNLGKAIGIGVAVKVDIKNVTVDGFKKSILTVLQDSKYFENAQKVSKLFQDKPQRPLDTAVWWCEFVMRNPNLDHLKSPTIALGPFVAKSYDVLLVIVIAIHLVAYLSIKVVKGLKKITSGKSKTD